MKASRHAGVVILLIATGVPARSDEPAELRRVVRQPLGPEQEDGDHPDDEELLERQTEHLYRIVGGEARPAAPIVRLSLGVVRERERKCPNTT